MDADREGATNEVGAGDERESVATKLPLFSANCHFVEPAHTFEGRMPKRLQDRAPKLVDAPDGGQQWEFEGNVRKLMRNCAVAGIPKSEWIPGFGMDTLRLEDLRPGCYDSVARLEDMDVDGIIATVCLSSPATMGFGCDLFAFAEDDEVGIAAMRAWNDWVLEEWVAADPTRFVPIQATWYRDPQLAAEEVRRNAERGFKGVTFRNPSDLGEPTVFTGHWDPFFRACEETGTVVMHHTDSGPMPPRGAGRNFRTFPVMPYGAGSVLFQSGAAPVVLHWVWGGIATRFPNVKIHVAESGGTWLPHLLRRMDWALDYSPVHADGWPEPGATPLELVKRCFVFSTLEVDAAEMLERDFGIEGWMLESDYPHFESVWPHTQEHYAGELAHLGPAEVRKLTWENVSRLYRHEVPAALQLPALDESASSAVPAT